MSEFVPVLGRAKHNLDIGKRGEEMARRYLEEKGYQIMEQNYRTKYGEIDLVAKKGKALVLVEVRSKIGENFGTPEETIDNKKKKKLRANALAYSRHLKWPGPVRVDAVCLVLKSDASLERLEHYENIIDG